jgi:hypothetical protein
VAEYAIVACDPAIVAGTIFLVSLLLLVVSSAVVIGVLTVATVAAIVCKCIADVGDVNVTDRANAVDNVDVDADSVVADAVGIVEVVMRFSGSFLLKDLGMKMDAFADSFC